jgi:hypothetical protein
MPTGNWLYVALTNRHHIAPTQQSQQPTNYSNSYKRVCKVKNIKSFAAGLADELVSGCSERPFPSERGRTNARQHVNNGDFPLESKQISKTSNRRLFLTVQTSRPSGRFIFATLTRLPFGCH